MPKRKSAANAGQEEAQDVGLVKLKRAGESPEVEVDSKTSGKKGDKAKGKLKKKESEHDRPKHSIKSLKPNQEYTKKSDLFFSDFFKERSWVEALEDVLSTNYCLQLEDLIASDYENGYEIFPPTEMIFNAFNLTPIDKVKVVILGQDPYHDDDQAHGLSFSVPKGIPLPPSLKNIYKELATDIPGFTPPDHGCLEKWAKDGVFLLNAFLTVQAHCPGSHARYGWKQFTDAVVQKISQLCTGIVFVLWGNFAHTKAALIDETKHGVIKTFHPSPLSFNKFQGCKCFSQTNAMLATYGKSPIDWTL